MGGGDVTNRGRGQAQKGRCSAAMLLLTAAVLISGCGRSEGASEQRPSVIVISVDTLRSDRLAAYATSNSSTPAIDALARESVVFEHAFSPVPQTLPAHAAMMTGLSPLELNVRDNIGYSLADGADTMAEAFSRAGYRTGGAVSAWVLRSATGIGQGFELWDDAVNEAPSGQQTIAQRAGDATRESLIRWIDTLSPDQPFLAFLHIYEPHAPWIPSDRAGQHPYEAEVERVDAIVSRLFEDLRRRGRWEETIVVLVSDHGEGLGDHGEDEHGILLYREALQVPLIVRIPGRSAARRGDLASIADLPATLANAAGIEWNGAGRDLFAEGEGPDHLLAFSDYGRIHLGWAPLRSAIARDDHLITGTYVELFDWKRDPAEQQNIAERRRREVATLREAIESADGQHPFSAPSESLDSEEREKLASLGYLGSAVAGAASERDPRLHIEAIRRFREVSAAVERGAHADAVPRARSLVGEEPSFAQAWGLFGQALRGTGDTAGAIDAFRTQLRLSPGNASAALALSELYARGGEWADATAHAELAIESEPEGARTLLLRIARASGDRQTLLRELEATEADTAAGLPRLLAAAEAARELGRSDSELALLRRAAEAMASSQSVPGVHFRMGELLLGMRRAIEADAAFARELGVDPANVRAWANRALIAGARGDRAAAETLLRQGRQAAGPAMAPAAAEVRSILGFSR